MRHSTNILSLLNLETLVLYQLYSFLFNFLTLAWNSITSIPQENEIVEFHPRLHWVNARHEQIISLIARDMLTGNSVIVIYSQLY